MYLHGQAGERGFAMAALLVSLAVVSVVMSVALPTWRHQVQREKEAELVFRGEQYVRAVGLYRAKNANAFPPSVDVLVQGRFLRKKFLDPITNQEFDVIGAASQVQAPGAAAGGRGAPTTPGGRANAAPAAGRSDGFTPGGQSQPTVPGASTGLPNTQTPSGFTSTVSGGIMGVHSKSKDTSIRIYQGQTKYNLWNFVFNAAARPGPMAPGAANPGGRGASPDGRGPGPGLGGGPGTGRGPTPGGGRGPQGPSRGGPFGGSPAGPFGGGSRPGGPGR